MIEAGLGGRLDATNVIPSQVTVLTSVGLEHTEWLGETERGDRGREAGGAARPVDAGDRASSSREVDALAEQTARERGATHRRAPLDHERRTSRTCGPRRFQRRNFALALAAARRSSASSTRTRCVRSPPALELPGRLEVARRRPAGVLDAAHNPTAPQRWPRRSPRLVGGGAGRRLPRGARRQGRGRRCWRRWRRRSSRGVAPSFPRSACGDAGRPGARIPGRRAELAAICEDAGRRRPEAVAEPGRRLRAGARPCRCSAAGVALAAGRIPSRCAWTERHAQSS